MNTILLVAVIIGITAIVTFSAFSLVKANIAKVAGQETCTTPTQNYAECKNDCTAENNCGRSDCGALKGRTCGCRAN